MAEAWPTDEHGTAIQGTWYSGYPYRAQSGRLLRKVSGEWLWRCDWCQIEGLEDEYAEAHRILRAHVSRVHPACSWTSKTGRHPAGRLIPKRPTSMTERDHTT